MATTEWKSKHGDTGGFIYPDELGDFLNHVVDGALEEAGAVKGTEDFRSRKVAVVQGLSDAAYFGTMTFK